jgi:DNA excision repair protein ERCC-4
MVDSARARYQLRYILHHARYDPEKKTISSSGIDSLLSNMLQSYFQWKGSLSTQKSGAGTATSSGSTAPQATTSTGVKRNAAPPNKRRRVRGGGASSTANVVSSRANTTDTPSVMDAFEQDISLLAESISQNASNDGDSSSLFVGPIDVGGSDDTWHSNITIKAYSYDEDDTDILNNVLPTHIIMFDADLGFIRRVEVFRNS